MSLRVALFAGALVLYALFGTPTPDSPGFLEFLIAVLLLGGLGAAALLRPFGIGQALPPALIPAQSLMFYGLSLPLLAGALQGHGLIEILRDAIPFLFFLLPLWAGGLMDSSERTRLLGRIMILMGLAFAARDFLRLMQGWTGLGILAPFAADPLSYLANAPTVLFAGLMLAGLAGRKLLLAEGMREIFTALLLFALALLPFLVMAAALQRASLGVAALVILLWLGFAFYRYPLRSLRLLIPLVVGAVLIGPFMAGLLDILTVKTASVGFNNRFEELGVIWALVSQNPLTLIFGLGWGAGFASPAVGGLHVNFAHSLLGAMLLKTGLVGLGLALIYLASFVRPLVRWGSRDSVTALALAAPFLIDTLLYAAYKSLDFGLILLLIMAVSAAPKRKD